MSFSLSETTTWTADDAFARLKQSLPGSWDLQHVVTEGWHQAWLADSTGTIRWSGTHADPKILFLDALGWIRLRHHQARHPIWKPRDQEVALHRPPLKEDQPDPPDLDPVEVEAVYKASR